MVLELSGPIFARISSKLIKLETNMKLVSALVANGEPHLLIVNIMFALTKQVFSIAAKKREETLVALEWNMEVEEGPKFETKFGLTIPPLIENEVNAIINQEIVHVSFNNLILKNTAMNRRVKGFVDINVSEKKVKISVIPHADREANKKFEVEASLDIKGRQHIELE